MKTKHTPGPWSADRMNLGRSKDRRSGFVVNGPDAAPFPVRICDIRCEQAAPFAVAEANSRLIAAVPELMQFALNVIAAIEENGRDANLVNMLADARQVTTKAEGHP